MFTKRQRVLALGKQLVRVLILKYASLEQGLRLEEVGLSKTKVVPDSSVAKQHLQLPFQRGLRAHCFAFAKDNPDFVMEDSLGSFVT